MNKGKQVALTQPDWIDEIKDEDIRLSVVSFMFTAQLWQALHGKEFKIDEPIRKYLKDTNEELSDEQIEEMAKILIEHNVVTEL